MEDSQHPIEKFQDSLGTLITGIPAPIRKNAWKAFGQLCTATVDIPVAWLEGKAKEIRATSDARVQTISQVGSNITQRIDVPDWYIQKAVEKFASRIVKEQRNLDDITNIALEELKNKQLVSKEEIQEQLVSPSTEQDVPEISEDWLNEFEDLARLKSTDDMKLTFGKILAGEISNPGSFSIKTLRIVSQLDNLAAKVFQIFCNYAIAFNIGDQIYDLRLLTIADVPLKNDQNTEPVMSYGQLMILQENDLILSTSPNIYNYSNGKENFINLTIRFQQNDYVLFPNNENLNTIIGLSGICASTAGRELLNVVPLIDTGDYKNRIVNYFKMKNLELTQVIRARE